MKTSCLLLLAALSCAAPIPAQPANPKHSQDWFRNAHERLDLRAPGSAPFHLTVRFHAYPGEELLAPGEHSQFITGDGVYDELWSGVHQWRREITLADYHAVEADNNGTRKMQASSSYEPSRVLMLLKFLLTPVAEDLADGSLRATGWNIDQVPNGALSLVRLSKVIFANQNVALSDSYYFQPDGDLVMSNAGGVVALWSNPVAFGSKTVPRHLSLKCSERILLSADISITPADRPDPAGFDLPGAAAEAGMTLRPLSSSEAKGSSQIGRFPSMAGVHGTYFLTGVLDRSGAYREIEVIRASDPANAATILRGLRNTTTQPRTVDHTPCEYVMLWQFML